MTKVLIVSSSSFLSRKLQFMLTYNRFTVHVAPTLCHAWILLREIHFSALIVDEAIEQGSGIDFCESIKRRNQNAPVLVIGNKRDRKSVTAFIKQNFSLAELRTNLNLVLGREVPAAKRLVPMKFTNHGARV